MRSSIMLTDVAGFYDRGWQSWYSAVQAQLVEQDVLLEVSLSEELDRAVAGICGGCSEFVEGDEDRAHREEMEEEARLSKLTRLDVVPANGDGGDGKRNEQSISRHIWSEEWRMAGLGEDDCWRTRKKGNGLRLGHRWRDASVGGWASIGIDGEGVGCRTWRLGERGMQVDGWGCGYSRMELGL